MYLVSKEDLERLKAGEIDIKDLTKPEREALFTYTGEDIKIILEKKKKKKDLETVVKHVRKGLEHCDCWACIDCAMWDVLGE